MYKVSFLIPSLNPQSYAQRAIDSIHEAHKDINYEILVYSTHEYKGPRIKWIKEDPKESKLSGCVFGFNTLYKHSDGDYVSVFVDDYIFLKGIQHTIDFIESDTFIDRRFKIATLECGGPKCYTRLGHILIGFPVYRRDTVENLLGGYLFHPRFNHHYSDHWLSWYLGEMGEPGLHTPVKQLQIHFNVHRTDHDARDEQVFLDLAQKFREGYAKYV